MSEAKEKLRDMLAEHLAVPADEIADDTVLFVDHEERQGTGAGAVGLPGDSLDRVEMLLAVEEEFGVTVPEGEEKAIFATLASAAAWIEAHGG